MAKAIYNPRYVEVAGVRELNTEHVKGFVWSHARWDLKVNEVKKFPDEVADALLKHIEFLVEVTPKNAKEIEAIRNDKAFKCEKCGFETDTKIGFISHSRTHKMTPEEEAFLDGIEEAAPKGKFQGLQRAIMKPEQVEGIPQGGTASNPVSDKDGVGWYGEGLSEDQPE